MIAASLDRFVQSFDIGNSYVYSPYLIINFKKTNNNYKSLFLLVSTNWTAIPSIGNGWATFQSSDDPTFMVSLSYCLTYFLNGQVSITAYSNSNRTEPSLSIVTDSNFGGAQRLNTSEVQRQHDSWANNYTERGIMQFDATTIQYPT